MPVSLAYCALNLVRYGCQLSVRSGSSSGIGACLNLWLGGRFLSLLGHGCSD